MLVHEGDSRTPRIDLVLATVLAFVAGGTNSAGYFAFGYFSANMTGNVSLISDHASNLHLDLALAFLAIVAVLILGAFSASLFIEIGKQRRTANIYALTLLVEFLLLSSVGLYATLKGQTANGFAIASLLSFAMGIQNAASTRISGSRIRTTHISGIATDIGVGLAILLGGEDVADRPQVIGRLQLHLATILSFLTGGVAGVLGYKLVGGMIFCGFSLILLVTCTRYLFWQK